MARAWVAILCAVLWLATARSIAAQNLFEVQVFPDENLARGETEIEFHNVVMSGGTRLMDNAIDPGSHVHLSVELTHAWTDAFETGVFLETAPATDDRHAAITGWHVRPKYRFAPWRRVPFHVSASLEYALFKNPGDVSFRQAIVITPILEQHTTSLDLSFNAGMEFALRGPSAGPAPIFEPSGKIASRTTSSLSLGGEYYAETGPIRRFEPVSEQHHLLFAAVDVRAQSGWNLNVGVGRGLTGRSEHWVLKTILGVAFPQ